jgi:hypothetical protein
MMYCDLASETAVPVCAKPLARVNGDASMNLPDQSIECLFEKYQPTSHNPIVPMSKTTEITLKVL